MGKKAFFYYINNFKAVQKCVKSVRIYEAVLSKNTEYEDIEAF